MNPSFQLPLVNCWWYFTKKLIGHKCQPTFQIIFVRLWVHARVWSWNHQALGNDGKVFLLKGNNCSLWWNSSSRLTSCESDTLATAQRRYSLICHNINAYSSFPTNENTSQQKLTQNTTHETRNTTHETQHTKQEKRIEQRKRLCSFKSSSCTMGIKLTYQARSCQTLSSDMYLFNNYTCFQCYISITNIVIHCTTLVQKVLTLVVI